VRVDTHDDAIELINSNSYANGTAIFTGSGHAARAFQRRVHVGIVGINVPMPVPMSFSSFGGWKDSLFGDHQTHGPEGVRFYTRGKRSPVAGPRRRRTPRTTGRMHFPAAV
jgi:malonate-semialdehyde dehydrogenase (acetylating)/methylmalonate-semialdehyde dehydrogenase